MRIVDVDAIVLRQPTLDRTIADGSQDDLLVLVQTEDGIIGIGEVDSSPEVAKAAIDAPASHANATGLRAVIVGQDDGDIPDLWRQMYRASIYYGRRGPALHAMSGIEMALWDIAGKRALKPVASLLGTIVNDRLRAYASVLMPESTGVVHDTVARLHDQGFTAVKLGWGPLGRDVDTDIRLTRAAVDGGGGMQVMIDAGLGYGSDVARARKVAEAYHGMGIQWLEEPFEPDELAAYAELADSVEIPIAAGEHETTRWGFEELLRMGHLDIVQPDVTRCGGLLEAVRISGLARASGKRCVTHGWKSGIIKAASLQVNAVLPGAEWLEYCVAETPLNQRLTIEKFPIHDGLVDVPSDPGLGVTLDVETLERYALTKPRIRLGA